MYKIASTKSECLDRPVFPFRPIKIFAVFECFYLNSKVQASLRQDDAQIDLCIHCGILNYVGLPVHIL